MTTFRLGFGLCLALLASACSSDETCVAGTEDCPCRRDDVCDKGLSCHHDEGTDGDRCVPKKGGGNGGAGAGMGTGGATSSGAMSGSDDPDPSGGTGGEDAGAGGAGGEEPGGGGESSSGGAPGSGGVPANSGGTASGGDSAGGEANGGSASGGHSPGSGGHATGGVAPSSGGSATGGTDSDHAKAGPFTKSCLSCTMEQCSAERVACQQSEVCASCLTKEGGCSATGLFGALAACICNHLESCGEFCALACEGL